MKSVWYRLTQRPLNIDDCIDLAGREPPKGARVDLFVHKLAREHHPVTQFVARFEVKYSRSRHVVKTICGGYLDTYSDERIEKKTELANVRLDELKAKLTVAGIPVTDSGQRFGDELAASPPILDSGSPYEVFADSKMILRDHLAIDRTVLANERTVLAYCRTSLALALTGAGVMKFFASMLSSISGWGLIVMGVIVAIVGICRSTRMARDIGFMRGCEIADEREASLDRTVDASQTGT
jgi:putative membrane protein